MGDIYAPQCKKKHNNATVCVYSSMPQDLNVRAAGISPVMCVVAACVYAKTKRTIRASETNIGEPPSLFITEFAFAM